MKKKNHQAPQTVADLAIGQAAIVHGFGPVLVTGLFERWPGAKWARAYDRCTGRAFPDPLLIGPMLIKAEVKVFSVIEREQRWEVQQGAEYDPLKAA